MFYEQLHPTMPQHMSDDDEENELETDGMPSAHTVHSAGESQRLEKAAYEKSHSHVQVMDLSLENQMKINLFVCLFFSCVLAKRKSCEFSSFWLRVPMYQRAVVQEQR